MLFCKAICGNFWDRFALIFSQFGGEIPTAETSDACVAAGRRGLARSTVLPAPALLRVLYKVLTNI